MSEVADVWFIRYPDGHIVRAASTAIVRQHLGSGRIPPASMVRRSPDEEWVSLAWTKEFVDLVGEARADNGPSKRLAGRERHPIPTSTQPITVASRLDPT